MAVVQAIRRLGKMAVYNMEVENHHNFSVCGGLVFHNCRYGLMSRPSPNEGSSFLPGSAEYYRSSDTCTDDEEDDDYQDSLGGNEGMGFYGI